MMWRDHLRALADAAAMPVQSFVDAKFGDEFQRHRLPPPRRRCLPPRHALRS